MKLVEVKAKKKVKYGLYDWFRRGLYTVNFVFGLGSFGCWLDGGYGDRGLLGPFLQAFCVALLLLSNAFVVVDALVNDEIRCEAEAEKESTTSP